VGCGPFTQSHKLLQLTEARVTQQLVLLDPLMEQYLVQVPTCRYRNAKETKANFPTVSGEIVLLASGGETIIDGALIPRMRNDKHGSGPNRGETFAYNAGLFDLVIIINVLEHCLDALQVIQNVHNALAPGGILVIHDRYSDHLWRNFFTFSNGQPKVPFWDVGHPINMLQAPFQHLFRQYRELYMKEGDPSPQHPQVFYFIGKKLTASNVSTRSIFCIIFVSLFLLFSVRAREVWATTESSTM